MSCGTCGDNKRSKGSQTTQAAGAGGTPRDSIPQQHCPTCGWFMPREGECTNPKCKTGREILKGCARTYVNQQIDDEGLDWWDVDKADGTLILQRVDDEQPQRIPLNEWYSSDLPITPKPKVGRLFEPDPAEQQLEDATTESFNPRTDGHPNLKRLFDTAAAEFSRLHLLYDDQGRLRDDPATCQDVADGLMVCMARELAETFDPNDHSHVETAVDTLERLWVDMRNIADRMPDEDPGSLLAVLDAATSGYDDVALYYDWEGNLSPEADHNQTLGAIIACELAQTYSTGAEYESSEVMDRMVADVEKVLRSIERLEGE